MSAAAGSSSQALVPARPRMPIPDYEFLPAALEILEAPLSPVRARMILALCGFTAIAVGWAYFGKVDMIATAQGKVQVVGQTKTIQPLEPGKVMHLAVENGQTVRAGDVLLSLDPSETQADVATVEGDLRARRAEASRRRLTIDLAQRRTVARDLTPSFEPGTPAEIAARETRVLASDMAQLGTTVASLEAQRDQKILERDRLRATIDSQRQLVATLKQRVDMRTELQIHDSGSKAAVIDAQEVHQTQQTYLAGLIGQLAESEAAIVTAGREIDKSFAVTISDNAGKLAEAERQADEDVQKLAKAQARATHMVLTSPIDGVVQGLSVTTVGQVLSSGEQLMQVVPSGGALEIEGYLSNADSGFVKVGQAATVKVDSFPFTTYGTIDAHVMRIARDAVPQVEASEHEENPIASRKQATFGGTQRLQNLVYPMSLKLERTAIEAGGTEVPLSPGMTVTIEIKTGSRRILSFLFSPLVETLTTAMRER